MIYIPPYSWESGIIKQNIKEKFDIKSDIIKVCSHNSSHKKVKKLKGVYCASGLQEKDDWLAMSSRNFSKLLLSRIC